MSKAVIGLIMSLALNALFAIRNFYGKKTQIVLSLAGMSIGLIEYSLVFYSPTYIIIAVFNIIYMLSYYFRRPLLHFFKVDRIFILMIVLFLASVGASVAMYTGPESIAGIVVLFLELFAVYLLSAQGMRYKNIVVFLIYTYLDIMVGNYFSIALDAANLVTPVIAISKNKKEPLLDKGMFTESMELVKLTNEARRFKKEMDAEK